MNGLIKSILEKNYTEAERLFNERIETIAEAKMVEKKKMIAAKDYLYETNMQEILGKIGKRAAS